MAQFVGLGLGHAGTQAVSDAHGHQIIHVLEPYPFDEAAYRGFRHLVHIVVEEMVVDEQCRFLDHGARVAHAGENHARHTGSYMVVIVEGRAIALAALGAGLGNIVKKGGQPHGELAGWAGGQGAHVVFPDRVDVVEVLGDADTLAQLGDDKLQESGSFQEFNAVGRRVRKNNFGGIRRGCVPEK